MPIRSLAIRPEISTAALTVVFLVWTLSVSANDYGVTNENGVRVFSAVPEVGVHPRVLMSPSDLPGWRKEVIKTYRGKTFFAKRFQSKRIDTLAAITPDTFDQDLLAAYPNSGPGDNHELLYATLDVIYHQDEARAEHVCRAVASFARVVLARSRHGSEWGKIEKDIGDIKGLDGIAAGLGHLWYRGGSDFALAYDYLYDYMAPGERDVCRTALSAATKDLVCWGMGFPRGRGISNWYGYHGELGPMLLAIEGEEGYHAEQWERFRQAIRDWAEVHIYETGGSNEDGYTGNTSLREGQFTLIAMARRGENHFDRPNIRNHWKWAVLSLVPGEDTGETVGYSSCRLSPYESAPVMARWAAPGDKNINFFLRQYKGHDYSRQNRWQYAPMTTLFCMNWEDTDALPLDMAKLDLPITAVFPYQGLFITRSEWSDEAAYLNMLARQDAWYDRHENVDRGRFVFAALGRRWAIDRPWAQATKSSDHNLVHVDGMAQAEASVGRGKAPNARLIKHGDVGNGDDLGVLSFGVMDLKNAYDWLWAHSWEKPGEGWEPETRSFEELGWTWERPGQPPALHGHDDENAPKYNFRGCNLWRAPNNPVEFCWRTGVLVRGLHPYAIIVDDVKKDDQQRTYDWYMQIPDDVEFVPQANGNVLLIERSEQRTYDRPNVGSRRLLVSPLGPGKPTIRLEEYTSGISRGVAHKARRLVVSRKDQEGRFRVLLYPFRTTVEPAGSTSREDWAQYPAGAVLPNISPATAGGFFLKLDERKDEWTFTPGERGRSRICLKRGGEEWPVD
ncbi:MAG: hypothetical protein H8E44_37240 [Planctomycetes bacterium]|nr:hypothetical protein [Planctomycetota bacterium]MBL7040936.1 hypothetical protein [Pirellulaceae bacterium]